MNAAFGGALDVPTSAFVGSTGVVMITVWAESVVDIARTGAWRRRLRDLASGAALAVASIPAAMVAAAVARESWPVLAALAPRPLPGALGLVVAFVVWDALGWVDHWLAHHTRLCWLTHRPHHTGRHFDLTLALRQSPLPLAGIALLPLVALTGASFAAMAVAVALSNTWQALVHTEWTPPLPRRLAAVVVVPATHRLHHERREAVNLAPVLTVWDRLAGTHACTAPDLRRSARWSCRCSSRSVSSPAPWSRPSSVPSGTAPTGAA